MTDRKNALLNRSEDHEAVVVVLPSSADKVDRDLVERALAHIREVLAKTVTRGFDEVGRYLLHAFYDDDPELYFSANPNKHASLRRLIERCESMELPVSRTFLGNALRMAAVTKGLPRAATFHRLPPSHRVELLRVRVPERLERLATKAVEGKLSVQKLRNLVQMEAGRTKSSSGRGRKRRPEVLKAIENCLRSLRDESTGRLLFHRSDVSDLTDEQQARADVALTSLEKRVAELRRILS